MSSSNGARRLSARFAGCAAILLLAAAATGCAAAPVSRTLTLRTLNGSGVTGTATFVAVDAHRTRIEIRVDPAGHPDMPAHIHPGTCDNLTPQPRYPLENVTNGTSTTVIGASMEELGTGQQSLNVHHSNENMGLFTACIELGSGGQSGAASQPASHSHGGATPAPSGALPGY